MTNNDFEIKKVMINSKGMKYVIIPKNSDFEKGDYVKIIKVGGDE